MRRRTYKLVIIGLLVLGPIIFGGLLWSDQFLEIQDDSLRSVASSVTIELYFDKFYGPNAWIGSLGGYAPTLRAANVGDRVRLYRILIVKGAVGLAMGGGDSMDLSEIVEPDSVALLHELVRFRASRSYKWLSKPEREGVGNWISTLAAASGDSSRSGNPSNAETRK